MSRAQRLVHQATSLEQHGDLAGAQEALAQAVAIDPAPAVALALARVRSKLGLLVEARDALTSTVYDTAPAGEPSSVSATRSEARQMFTDLASRIPRVRVVIEATPGSSSVRLTLDGTVLPAGVERLPVPLDPGHHVLVAAAPGMQPQTFAFDAAESSEQKVAVHLVAAAPIVAQTRVAEVAVPPPPVAPATTSVPVLDPPVIDRDERLAAARRAKFSLGRFFLESLGSALVGSLAAYGTYKAACGNQPCIGGSLEGLGVNVLVTPVTVWGLGEVTGGDGGLGWAFLGGLVAFSGYTAGTTDPILPLVIGVVLMPFTSALMYELSSNGNAQRVLGPKAGLTPAFAPLYGVGNSVVGATGGVGGRF